VVASGCVAVLAVAGGIICYSAGEIRCVFPSSLAERYLAASCGARDDAAGEPKKAPSTTVPVNLKTDPPLQVLAPELSENPFRTNKRWSRFIDDQELPRMPLGAAELAESADAGAPGPIRWRATYRLP
jgi:hypothetical protein